MLLKNIAGAIALFGATAANAETLDFDFDLIDIDSVFIAAGTGSLTYDDSLLAFDLDESISINGFEADFADPSLTIDLSIAGLTFSEDNDVDASDFPVFEFFDGRLDFVNFVLEDGENGVDLSTLGIKAFELGGPTFDRITGELSFTAQELLPLAAVPLPAGGLLLFSALGMGALARRKR